MWNGERRFFKSFQLIIRDLPPEINQKPPGNEIGKSFQRPGSRRTDLGLPNDPPVEMAELCTKSIALKGNCRETDQVSYRMEQVRL